MALFPVSQPLRRSSLAAAILAALLAASGCATNDAEEGAEDAPELELDTAASDDEDDEDLVPVLALQRDLVADLRFIGVSLPIPVAFSNTEWTQPGGEPDHAMHHLDAPQALERAWRARIGRGGTASTPLTGPPIVADGMVFAIDAAGQVSAFNIEDGETVWQRSIAPDLREAKKRFWQFGRVRPADVGFGGGVAYDNGRAFATSGFGIVAGFNAESGEVIWQNTLDAPVRNPPTAAEGKVFVLTTDNQLVAMDQITGETLWSYDSFEETARFLSSASVAVGGGIAVAPFSSGEVAAIDTETGRLLWTATVARASRLNALSNLNDIAGSPVVDRGAVFAISHAGQISAIDARTGRTVWEVGVGGLSMPWVADDFLFLISVDRKIVAMSREDGAVAWTRDLPAFVNPKNKKRLVTWAGPVLAGERLLVTSSNGTMRQLSPQNGETLATFKLAGPSFIAPVVAGGTVYTLSAKGELEAWR